MSVSVLSYLVGISVRSILLAGVAALFVLAFRIRGAATRHAVATSVLAGMLLLPALQPFLPTIPVPVLGADAGANPNLPSAQLPATMAPARLNRSIPTLTPVWLPTWKDAAVALYGTVVLILMIRLAFGYLFTRRLVRASRPVQSLRSAPPVFESNWISTPLTVGFLRPKILLPSDWRDWPADKLHSVLAHEQTHVRRADWAVALCAAVNRRLFWFNPLVWILERTLASLAEEACDDAALLEVDTGSYAQALLDMAAAVRTAQGRLTWEAMAMAKATEVRKRIERILDETRQIPRGLTRTRWIALAACALPLIYVAAVVQPVPVRAQQAPIGELLKKGRQLAAGEVGTMEQYVAAHPDDLDARTQLITYYYAHGIRRPRIDHILWLIANHPESQATIFSARGLTPSTTTLNDSSDFTRAGDLWKQQAAAHPTDARVLGNAASFFSQPGGDYEQAERLLLAGYSVEPNGQWSLALGKLYAAAILADTGDPRFPGMNSAFAARVRTQLENSNDGDFVTVVGAALTGVAKRAAPGRPLPAGVLDLNEHPLLVSAVEFGQRLLDRFSMPGAARRLPAGIPPPPPPPPPPGVHGGVISGVIGGVPGGVAPPPPPPAGVNGGVIGGVIGSIPADAPPPPPPPARIKIGGQVQAANLIRQVRPVYPEEAKTAGIEGDVVLKVQIAEDGHVESAEPSDGNPILAAAAVEAVLQWKYKPTLLNGSPVQVVTTVTVSFQK